METTLKTGVFNASLTRDNSKKASTFWEDMEFNRYGVIAVLIIITGCLGGISISFGAGNDVARMLIVALPTSLTLAFILALTPMRLIVTSSAVAVLIDVVMLMIQKL